MLAACRFPAGGASISDAEGNWPAGSLDELGEFWTLSQKKAQRRPVTRTRITPQVYKERFTPRDTNCRSSVPEVEMWQLMVVLRRVWPHTRWPSHSLCVQQRTHNYYITSLTGWAKISGTNLVFAHFIWTSFDYCWQCGVFVRSHSCCRRLSVSPSVCQTRGMWQNEIILCQCTVSTPYDRGILLVSW